MSADARDTVERMQHSIQIKFGAIGVGQREYQSCGGKKAARRHRGRDWVLTAWRTRRT